MAERWQCQFVNSKGERCSLSAIFRLHFSHEHPFDHVDLCQEHSDKYPHYLWFHRLSPPESMKKEQE